MTSTLTQLPRTSTLYWEAALSVMRRPGALKTLPPLSLRLGLHDPNLWELKRCNLRPRFRLRLRLRLGVRLRLRVGDGPPLELLLRDPDALDPDTVPGVGHHHALAGRQRNHRPADPNTVSPDRGG